MQTSVATCFATLGAALTSVACLVLIDYFSMIQRDLSVALSKVPILFLVAIVVVATVGVPVFARLRSVLTVSALRTAVAGAAGGLMADLLIGLAIHLMRRESSVSLIDRVSLSAVTTFALTGALAALVFVWTWRVLAKQ